MNRVKKKTKALENRAIDIRSNKLIRFVRDKRVSIISNENCLHYRKYRESIESKTENPREKS